MIKSKLTALISDKYRRTADAVIPSEDEVQSIKKAVCYLQRYFDISVSFDYQTKQRAVSPKLGERKEKLPPDGRQIAFEEKT